MKITRIMIPCLALCMAGSLSVRATTLFIFQNENRFNTFEPTHTDGIAYWSEEPGTGGEAGRVNVAINESQRRTYYYRQMLTPAPAGITASFDFLAQAATTTTTSRVAVGFSQDPSLDFRNNNLLQARLIKNGSTAMSLEIRGTSASVGGLLLTTGTWYRISASCIPHPGNHSYTITARLEDLGPDGNATRPTLLATTTGIRNDIPEFFSETSTPAPLYAGFLAQNDGGGATAVDNYYIRRTPAPSISHQANISTENIGNYFEPDTDFLITVNYLESAVNHPGNITLTLLNSADEIVLGKNVSAGSSSIIPGQDSGFYRILATADHELLASTTIGILPEEASDTTPDPDSRFGTIAHLKNMTDTDRDLLLNIAARAQIGWIREGFLWHQVQPTSDTWSWERYDKIVEKAENHGINVLPVLSFGTSWASTAPAGSANAYLYQPQQEPWQNYVSTLARRYPSIRNFEVWNEPNGSSYWKPQPNADEYAQTAAQAYEVLKEIDTGYKVLTAGFGPSMSDLPDEPSKYESTFIEALYEHSPRPFDAVAFHPYTVYQHLVLPSSTTLQFERNLSHIREGMTGHEDSPESMPLWITEFGVSTIPRIATERFAADHITHLLTLADADPAIEKMFVYNLRDVGTDYTNKEHMFGLIHYDNTPKPGLFAYWHFINATKKATLASITNINGIRIQHYIDTSSADLSRHLLIAWSDSPSGISSTLDIPPDATNLSIRNNLGTLLNVPKEKSFNITTSPVFVEYLSSY